MSIKDKIGLLALASVILVEDFGNKKPIRPEVTDVTPKEPPVPKGCKRYYYNMHGLCCKDEGMVYFDAMKPSKAFAKYQKWLKSKQTDLQSS